MQFLKPDWSHFFGDDVVFENSVITFNKTHCLKYNLDIKFTDISAIFAVMVKTFADFILSNLETNNQILIELENDEYINLNFQTLYYQELIYLAHRYSLGNEEVYRFNYFTTNSYPYAQNTKPLLITEDIDKVYIDTSELNYSIFWEAPTQFFRNLLEKMMLISQYPINIQLIDSHSFFMNSSIERPVYRQLFTIEFNFPSTLW